MSYLKHITLNDAEYDIRDDSVPDWAREDTKPEYAASEISGLAAVAVTGSYSDLTNAITDDHINELIDTKLGVIENGAY